MTSVSVISALEGRSNPNEHLHKIICQVVHTVSSAFSSPIGIDSRSELDSHANMMVLGKNCFIFDTVHGRTCDVEPFDRSLGVAKIIPFVDASLSYDCPITHESYLLIIRNALYVETMEVNLLSPFIMREAGLLVNDTPKIHVDDPNEHHHVIVFPDDDLSIPLRLNGTFSFFHRRTPTFDEVKFKDPIFLTQIVTIGIPTRNILLQTRNPWSDWEGNMTPKRHRKEHVLDLNVSVDESTYDNAVEAATISSFNAMSLNDCHDDMTGFAAAMSVRAVQSKFAMGIGSTSTHKEQSLQSPPCLRTTLH